MGRRVEGNDYSPPCSDAFKISKREKSENDLNRQIYPYFKNGLAILVYD